MMHQTSPFLLTSVVTVLAIIFYIFSIYRVTLMRSRHKIEAPMMTGHPELERAVRVQTNTLEAMPIFLPALWLATVYFKPLGWLPCAIGILWIVGRIIYMQGYMTAPAKRSVGFGISALAQILLLVLAIIGLVLTWANAITTS
jgi:glutathione S-transferase